MAHFTKREGAMGSLNSERERLHHELLSSVSHDLKTPLAGIIGSLEVHERMRDKLSEEKKAALLDMALQEAYRLDSFITNILDMAKLENGNIKVRKETCRLEPLLQDCLMIKQHALRHADVKINTSSKSLDLVTDRGLLTRSVCILLDNAAKYAPERPVIDLDYYKNDTTVDITIQDNGPGISQARMPILFSRVARLEVQDHAQAGTGLGLPICQEIMHLLGGEITIANRVEGNGTICTLSLPIGNQAATGVSGGMTSMR